MFFPYLPNLSQLNGFELSISKVHRGAAVGARARGDGAVPQMSCGMSFMMDIRMYII